MVVLHLRVRDERIEEAKFEGAGCAISTASASMMTDVVRDRTIAEARGLADRFRKMVSGEADAEAAMGQLVALQGVRAYPMRVKCATLPWHALTAALDDTSETVTTE
jgi:nitrogen fixation NifU-like protein